MRKTRIYLSEVDVERLRRLAAAEGKSQADIVRAAIASYELLARKHREFALSGAWAGDGTSVAELTNEELLEGFGS